MQINVLEYLQRTSIRLSEHEAVAAADARVSFSALVGLAHALSLRIRREAGVENQPIAVLADKSCQAIVAILAVLMSGNIYCPLDPKSPPARLARIVAKLGSGMLLYQRAKRAVLEQMGGAVGVPLEMEEIAGQLSRLGPVDLEALWADIARHLARRIDSDPCYVIFTSGSTGEPKGVTIAHRSVIDYIDWAVACYGVTDAERIGNQAPLFFDNSTLDLYLCFATGACLHIVPEALFSFPLRLMQFLDQEGISTIFWVPSVLINVANTGVLDELRPRHLRKVLFAGEVMPVRQLNHWIERLPQALFSNLYGPTEITVDCTYFMLDGPYAGNSLPIGYPCRNSDVLVLGEDGRQVGAEQAGELCVRGNSLALGYWNDPERSAAVFVQNPAHRNYRDLVYRTGDLVRRDERGCIFFIGRKDQQIKLHGYRIELGEIESAALRMDAIESCCAVLDRARERICLVVQGADRLDPGELRRCLADTLPKYMLPAEIRIVAAMPLTANGKIDRQKLLELVGA
ncbi:MAG TPA: amino acid adenylation domain-containing protein [Burkholderiales bacterium]|nr:amino acid adenylation domain-containing protein [Burkholderiales bacterium]